LKKQTQSMSLDNVKELKDFHIQGVLQMQVAGLSCHSFMQFKMVHIEKVLRIEQPFLLRKIIIRTGKRCRRI
jgi:hypothetical protein